MSYPNDFPESKFGAEHVKNELLRIKFQTDLKPKSKNQFHNINLTMNVEKKIPSPPNCIMEESVYKYRLGK